MQDGLILTTDPQTDFWQRTHYGFQRDNGHALLTEADGSFTFTTRVRFQYAGQYDQCGIMVRVDDQQWIKVSLEYEDSQYGRLGSVVTHLGYSDWATTDVSSKINELWYRVQREGDDFTITYASDGQEWIQMRITHLHGAPSQLKVGFYACSPQDSSFTCTFDQASLTADS